MSNGNGNVSVRTVNADQFKDRIFFSITPHRWGNRAKIKSAEAHREYLRLKELPVGTADASAEPVNGNGGNGRKGVTVDRTTSTKSLIDAKSLDSINEAMTDLKDRLVGKIRGLANPSFIARGIYSIRKDLVGQVESMITATETKINAELKPALIAEYPEAVDRSRNLPPNKGGLGPIFDPDDYPSADAVASRFWLEWSYLQLGVADDLPNELKQKKLAEWEKKMADAYEESINALRVSFQELIAHASDKLSVQPGEKPKVFRDSLIGNIDEFIAAFAARNMGDQALADLVEKARKVIRPNGDVIDPDRLRKFANVRDGVASQFKEIQTVLDGMIVERKGRKIDLSEEE